MIAGVKIIALVLMVALATACASTSNSISDDDAIVLSPYGVIKDQEVSPSKIVRHFPEGEIRNATQLGVVFSDPMVPLAETGRPIADAPPITISPHIDGTWRWLDQRTLAFIPQQQRFNYSTMYKIALSGEIQGRRQVQTYSHAWTFSTKRLRSIKRGVDWDEQSQRYKFIVGFNQPVDSTAVAPFIVLTDGLKEYEITTSLIDDGLWQPHQKWRHPEAQAVEVVAKHTLPTNTEMRLFFKEGMPAKEGELAAEEMDDYTFRTRKELNIEEVTRDEDRAVLKFNNQLKKGQDLRSLIMLTPSAESTRIYVSGSRLYIEGLDNSLEYSARIEQEIKDIYGQSLGHSNELLLTLAAPKKDSLLLMLGEYTAHFSKKMITLGPGEPREIPFKTLNVDSLTVELRSVEPSEYKKYLNIKSMYEGLGRERAIELTQKRDNHGLPGVLVKRFKVNTKAEINKTFSGAFNLKPALSENGWGQLILMVEGVENKDKYSELSTNRMIWIQSTNLALHAIGERDKLMAWVTSLDSALPVKNATVEINGQRSFTNTDGLTVFHGDDLSGHLVAKINGDSVFLSHDFNYFTNRWFRSDDERLVWHVFDDRAIYKPGETLSLKGTVRKIEPGKGLKFPDREGQIKWKAHDAKRSEFAAGVLVLDDRGNFDFTLTLPKDLPLGEAFLNLSLIGEKSDEPTTGYFHRFSVIEYRKPEFEVEVSFSEPQNIDKNDIVAEAKANYYTGEPLAGANVDWTFYGSGSFFKPEGRDQFEFGDEYRRGIYYKLGEAEGVTNKFGEHSAPVTKSRHRKPSKVRAVASVQDVNNQSWSGSAEYVLPESELYVGLRSHANAVRIGEDVVVDAVVINSEGKSSARAELTGEMRGYDLKEPVAVIPECQWIRSEEIQRCIFQGLARGRLRISAVATDEKGNTYNSYTSVAVVGEKPSLEQYQLSEEDSWYSNDINFSLDQQEYQPGDTANVYIETPFQNGEALVTYRQAGIIEAQRVYIENGYYHLNVPISEEHIPNFWVQVDAVIDVEQAKKIKRGFTNLRVSGEINIPVSAESRKLSVNISTERARYAPGDNVTAVVDVTDVKGIEVKNAEVTFYAVDEAVLASSGYITPEPSDRFYEHRKDGSWDYTSRNELAFLYSDLGENPGSGGVMAMAAGRNGPVNGRVRKDFSALATFQANLITDQKGRVTANFTLPDSLTRYKLIAVAQADTSYFGSGESTVETYLPLMVRPSLPRFLNMGDHANLPVVLQNSTDRPITVDVKAEGHNLTIVGSEARTEVTISAHDRVQVSFPVQPSQEGVARLKVSATTTHYRDEIVVEIPVYSPTREVAIAYYGNLADDKAKFKLLSPESMQVNAGRLEVSSSSSQLQSLQDAYVYLVNYPYSCSEQLSSRLLSVIAMQQAADIFSSVHLPETHKLSETLTSQIDQLLGRQNDDGGWALWRKGKPSQAFLSVHVIHALVLARRSGYDVPVNAIERGFAYLEDGFIEELETKPWPAAMQALAYAIYLQAEHNRSVEMLSRTLAQKLDNEEDWNSLPVSALGWLIHAFSGLEQHDEEKAQLYDALNARLVETASKAMFAEEYGSWRHSSLASSSRANAIVLISLLKDRPNSELIDKLVRGLVADRGAGRWKSTQENVFVLLAFKSYYDRFESDDVDLTFTVKLNGSEVSQKKYADKGDTQDKIVTPLQDWGRKNNDTLVSVSAKGDGRIFYRLAASHVPRGYRQGAANNGFSVDRYYEAVDDPADVQLLEDGTWKIRAGAEVRVTLAMNTQETRYNVALVDSLPAGLEPVDASLANVDDNSSQKRSNDTELTYKPDWYEHSELRDTGAQAFVQRLPAGGYSYSYTARAITPGEYTAPALRAEEMYSPEVFGQSNSAKVLVY